MADRFNYAIIEQSTLTDGSLVNAVILRDLEWPSHVPLAIIHAGTLAGAQAICDAINKHAIDID
jgi:hypothetical protein